MKAFSVVMDLKVLKGDVPLSQYGRLQCSIISIFSNDLLVFCKADVTFLKAVEVFINFANLSGQHLNEDKTKLYVNNSVTIEKN